MSYFLNRIACLVFVGLCSTIALAQNDFPSTQYHGFDDSTNRPDCECDGVDNDWPSNLSVPDAGDAENQNSDINGCRPQFERGCNDNDWPTNLPDPETGSTQNQKSDSNGCKPQCECECDDNDWPTSSPVTPDPGPCVSDNRSMSPNSWSAPPKSADIENAGQTPDVPDLNSTSPFQSAGYARNQKSILKEEAAANPSSSVESEATTSGPPRHPLDNNLGASDTNDSVEPDNSNSESVISGPFSSIDTWYDPVGTKDSPLLAETSADNSLALPSSKYSTHSPTPNRSAPTPNRSAPASKYRPDLGQRDVVPTIRNYGSYDDGRKFDFENKKKEYPPMKEILATGRYFGSASILFLKPSFQRNTSVTTFSPGFSESIPFDFDYEGAPQFEVGFESEFGPGIKLNYWQYDESSNPTIFTSDGVTIGETSTWTMGLSRGSRLVAANAGERINATHSIDVESIEVSVFKEVKLPISRIVGSAGYRFASIQQSLRATLSSGGTVIDTLDSRFDINASGPQLSLEYYRPIGHTKLEFLTTAGGSVLFGRRNEFATNTATGDLSRVGADEFITTIDFMAGVQFKKMIAENRAWFARIGFQYENWLGGGTAVNAQDDFGLRGFLFTVGYNR